LGLAVVSLIVLVLLGALAGLILTRVFGAAAARNQRRPGAGKTEAGEI
jgi:flagellar basal body-associated protein FliL